MIMAPPARYSLRTLPADPRLRSPLSTLSPFLYTQTVTIISIVVFDQFPDQSIPGAAIVIGAAVYLAPGNLNGTLITGRLGRLAGACRRGFRRCRRIPVIRLVPAAEHRTHQNTAIIAGFAISGGSGTGCAAGHHSCICRPSSSRTFTVTPCSALFRPGSLLQAPTGP